MGINRVRDLSVSVYMVHGFSVGVYRVHDFTVGVYRVHGLTLNVTDFMASRWLFVECVA